MPNPRLKIVVKEAVTPEYHSPAVSIDEINPGNRSIENMATSTAGFLGIAERGLGTPTLISSFNEYHMMFGGYVMDGTQDRYLTYAVLSCQEEPRFPGVAGQLVEQCERVKDRFAEFVIIRIGQWRGGSDATE